MRAAANCPRVKRPERKADDSYPPNAEFERSASTLLTVPNCHTTKK